MSAFTKLDSGIVHSTIWVQPHDVLRVWIAMLALADQHGIARTAAPALANLCMIPVDRMREIIAILESPDEDSRSEVEEGRRIVKIDGGWQLVNHAAYRARRDPDADRERKREWDRQHRPSGHARSAQSDASPTPVRQSDSSPLKPTQAEAEADTEKQHSAQPAASRFADFWQAYPRKRGKKPAEVKWKVKRLDARADEIIADVRKRIANDDRWNRGFIPDPATYLGQERWDDALSDGIGAGPPSTPSPKSPSETPLEAALAHARYMRDVGGLDDTAYEAECQRVTAKYRGQAEARA